MKAIFTIQHPAHVHFFRNSIETLSEEGHDIYTLARKKEINVELLEQYDIEYKLVAGEPKGSWHLPFIQLKYEWEIIRASRKLNADVLVAIGEPAIAHAATLTDSKSLVFTDTEHATFQNSLAFPFADRILTPDCYMADIGSKQTRYPGYHELAYLHPNRFDPDESILDEIDADQGESLVILRLVSWDAAHDVGDSGFDDVTDVVRELEATGSRVLITSEAELPADLESNQIGIAPHRIHHLMYYADLFIGESATMAAESAVLGTPAIFVSTIELGYTNKLESKYNLVYNFQGPDRQSNALERALSLLEEYDASVWKRRRERLLDDKIDTTEFIISQVNEIVNQK